MKIYNGKKILRDLEPWFAQGLFLMSSRIHGQGLFTKREFSKGDILIRLGGFLINKELRNTSLVIPSTSTAITDEIILSEIRESQKDKSDFINHSCDPNVGFTDAITLIATRKIIHGEEITLDYAYCEADEFWVLKNLCTCNSTECRKNITGQDWKNPELTKRFLLWASPFIKKRIIQFNYSKEKK